MTSGGQRRRRFWPAVVVFDYDGVLTETGEVKVAAFRKLFAEHPRHLDAIVRHHLDHLGVSRFEKFDWIYRELLGRPLDRPTRDRLGRRFSELVVGASSDCPEVAGATRCLEALHAEGVPLHVASGIPEEELTALITGRGWSPYFDGVHGSPRSKSEILGGILDRHAVAADRVVFVGDGWSDYQAARATGVRFVLRETPEQRDRFRGVDVARIADLHPLPELLSDRPGVGVAR